MGEGGGAGLVVMGGHWAGGTSAKGREGTVSMGSNAAVQMGSASSKSSEGLAACVASGWE